MEHPEDNLSNPNDDLAKRRFGVRESLGGGESDAEKKRREEEEEKKKRREQAEKRRREEQERQERAEEGAQEQSWFGGDKPTTDKRPEGFLGALFGEEAGEKNQKKSDKSEEAPASSTEQSPEDTSAEAKQQAPDNQTEAAPTDPETEATESAELDPSEKAEAAKAYVTERLKQIDEDSEDGSKKTLEASDEAVESRDDVEEQPDNPVKQFLQRLQKRLDDGDPTALEDDQLDQLAAEVASAELDGASPGETVAEATGVDDDMTAERDGLSYEDIETSPAEDMGAVSIEADDLDNATPEFDEDDMAAIPTTSVQPASSGSGGGTGAPPPTAPPPPVVPPSSGGGGHGGGPAVLVSMPGSGRASAPTSESRSVLPGSMPGEATARTVTREVARGVRSGGEFLLGAFVGYFIGNRRGRNKAEAELAPQQKKIEKELRDVQSSIEQREQALIATQRRAEQAERSATSTEAQPVSKEAQPTAPRPEAAQSTQPAEAASAKPVERKAAKEAPASTASTEQTPIEPAAEERSVPEPEQAPRPPVPEILAASTVRSVVESIPEVPPQAEQSGAASAEYARQPSAASIDSMPRTELLNRAQAVEFRGESLKQMYEADKVDEATVREVMRMEARGQSYERLLMRRVAEYEAVRIGQSSEQILDPHPERHVTDPRSAERELEAVGFAGNLDASQSSATSVGDTLYPQSTDDGGLSNGADSANNQTNVAPQVAVGVVLGIVFVVMLFWLFG